MAMLHRRLGRAGLQISALSFGAWMTFGNPRVSTVILGASKPARLTENLGALEVLPNLASEILAHLDSICAPAAT